jgi:hypothetical protein
MRSYPTWASILKKLSKCALRYVWPPPGVSTVITGMRSVRNVDATPPRPAVRFGRAAAGRDCGWEPQPGPAWRPVTAVRPLRISVRGALACGVKL